MRTGSVGPRGPVNRKQPARRGAIGADGPSPGRGVDTADLVPLADTAVRHDAFGPFRRRPPSPTVQGREAHDGRPTVRLRRRGPRLADAAWLREPRPLSRGEGAACPSAGRPRPAGW